MPSPESLTLITLIMAGILVAALVFYLSGILIALWKAGTHLQGLNQALAEIESNSDPLQDKVGAINGALDQLGDGLQSVGARLGGIAEVFRL